MRVARKTPLDPAPGTARRHPSRTPEIRRLQPSLRHVCVGTVARYAPVGDVDLLAQAAVLDVVRLVRQLLVKQPCGDLRVARSPATVAGMGAT